VYVLAHDNTITKYPYSLAELRSDNPYTSFPKNPTNSELGGWNVYPVQSTSRPVADHTQNVTENDPILVNGVWTQSWSVTAASEDEINQRTSSEAENVRYQRNSLLSSTDWTQVKDVPQSVSNAWASYRQALRDMPQQEGFPWSVVWPEEPELL
jgi:hypothetical protein